MANEKSNKTKKFDPYKRVSFAKPVFAENLSREQELMHEMFGSSRTWGTGENLPQFNGALISGNGLINNEDEGETSSMFGMRR